MGISGTNWTNLERGRNHAPVARKVPGTATTVAGDDGKQQRQPGDAAAACRAGIYVTRGEFPCGGGETARHGRRRGRLRKARHDAEEGKDVRQGRTPPPGWINLSTNAMDDAPRAGGDSVPEGSFVGRGLIQSGFRPTICRDRV